MPVAIWDLGTLCGIGLLLWGGYLTLDFNFYTAAKLQRVIAQLAFYESLVRRELVETAKAEALLILGRAAPVPFKPRR